jgi:hypothetical protein
VILNPTATNIDTRIVGTNLSIPSIYVDSSTGNVGVRNTSPSYPLTVTGNIFSSGLLTSFIQNLTTNPTSIYNSQLTFSQQYENTTSGAIALNTPQHPGESAFLINEYNSSSATIYFTDYAPSITQVQQCAIQYGGYTYTGGQYAIYQLSGNTIVNTWSLSGGYSTSTCYAIEFNPSDGTIWVGGDFTSINGTTCNFIARINISTYDVYAVIDDSTGSEGFNNVVYALQWCGYSPSGGSNGGMAIGGQMTGCGSGSGYSTNPQNIAMYYGTSPYYYDNSFASSCTASGGTVYALAWGYHASYGDSLFIGGSGFSSSASGTPYLFIFVPQLNSSYNTYNSMTSLVRVITYISQNEVLIGGEFTSIFCSGDSNYANYILYYDTYSNFFYTISNGAGGPVYSILNQGSFGGTGFVWVAGNFYTSSAFPYLYNTITWIIDLGGTYILGNASQSYSIYQWYPSGISQPTSNTFISPIPILQQGGSALYTTVTIAAMGYTCFLRANNTTPPTKWYIIAQTGCTFG